MGKLFRWQRDLDPFEEELDHQMLVSERGRAGLLVGFTGIFTALGILTLTGFRPVLATIERLIGSTAFFDRMIWVLVAAFLYEAFLFTLLGAAVRRRVQVPALPRYVNAFIEVSLPTLVLWIMAQSSGAAVALNAPPYLLYFLFIILSTLRLRFSISLFTGVVAGVEFFAVALYFLYGNEAAGFFDSWVPAIPKAGFLVVAGALAGFVARRIHRQIQASVRLTEDRNRVVGLFGQHVSPQVVERLLAQKEQGGGELRHVAVLFLDIRGFTKFSESRTPGEIVAFLNALFTRHIEVVNAHGGIINKFLGDGFMAVFGAPLSDGNDCRNALGAALALADATDELVGQGAIPPTRIGIGIHAGDAVTGSVGSARRREYTIIGDTVNLASRVESLNKEFGSTILATEAAWKPAAGTFTAKELPAQKIRGREGEVVLYQLR
ncbi:MAG: adenylate/guanylate cyclase domain-containing protein [Spirochaetes bacterium]|nr:adenylate/guanylate cyclase domain-containing protein [Spirochaetota bacterium]